MCHTSLLLSHITWHHYLKVIQVDHASYLVLAARETRVLVPYEIRFCAKTNSLESIIAIYNIIAVHKGWFWTNDTVLKYRDSPHLQFDATEINQSKQSYQILAGLPINVSTALPTISSLNLYIHKHTSQSIRDFHSCIIHY